MATYLLASNPKKWNWGENDFEKDCLRAKSRGHVRIRWSTGNRKDINPGDHIYMIRLGVEPKGLFASGYAVSEVEPDKHWSNRGRQANYVWVNCTTLINPEIEHKRIVPLERLLERFPEVHWQSQSSGILIPEPTASKLKKLWFRISKGRMPTHDRNLKRIYESPGAITYSKSLMEGTLKRVYVNAYERKDRARRDCLKIHGLCCSVCGFNFEVTYGPLGRGFIHVHHLIPLSKIRKKYNVDPKHHLRPVCPNCHEMLHKKDPPMDIQELRRILKRKRPVRRSR